jgi:hypothetical protein
LGAASGARTLIAESRMILGGRIFLAPGTRLSIEWLP